VESQVNANRERGDRAAPHELDDAPGRTVEHMTPPKETQTRPAGDSSTQARTAPHDWVDATTPSGRLAFKNDQKTIVPAINVAALLDQSGLASHAELKLPNCGQSQDIFLTIKRTKSV
jgi:hypothetical protein